MTNKSTKDIVPIDAKKSAVPIPSDAEIAIIAAVCMHTTVITARVMLKDVYFLHDLAPLVQL